MMETTKRGGVPLYLWMLVGFAAGMGGGLYVNLMGLEVIPWVMDSIQAVGQIFLRLLFMLVLPLLFAALAVGVAEMGDLK
jgi:Na+/H+-dicarboxylate symporter